MASIDLFNTGEMIVSTFNFVVIERRFSIFEETKKKITDGD